MKEARATVASQRWKRIRSGALIAATMAAVAGATIPLSASAAPASPPTTKADALAQYKSLTTQAEKLDEDLLAAKNDLTNKQGQLKRATATLTSAKQAEQQAAQVEKQFQGQVDQFAEANYDGARLNQLSALLTGTSTHDFLDRATMINEIATANDSAMNKLESAVKRTTAAQHQATTAAQQSQAATTAAAKLVSTISGKQKALDSQIAKVKAALNKLTVVQKKSLSTGSVVGSTSTFLGPPGVINTVLQAALSRRGDEYVWGAAGPSQFDCSGLVLWSYAKGGITLPHSSRVQYTYGKPVAYGQWKVGDLLFFGSSAASIHHVAMYVGNGDIVQAPTTGVPVEVVPVSGGGSDYYGAKRIVG
jgi:cell wall-associated NlpC family hydrolase